MPYSSDEGKQWMVAQIWDVLHSVPPRIDPEGWPLAPRVLDIGAGSGTYADLLLEKDRGTRHYPHETAIEIHAPYVERFGLRRKYDEVIVGDARTVPFPVAEVVILGDVLEHMSFEDARAVWAKARAACTTAVFLSLPIIEWVQGESEGNAHEAHLETWMHERVMAELEGIRAFWLGMQIGCYRADPLRSAE